MQTSLESPSDATPAYESLDVAQLANVSGILTEGKKFVCWREAIRNAKPTKIPVNPHNGHEAESDNPATWGTLAEAVAHYQSHRDTLHGVGRMFDPADGILGIDFDDCLDDHGNIIASHAAAEWLPRLNSYSEKSPSGRGVKVWLQASHNLDCKTGRRDAKRGVEIYRERRYFTLTGRRSSQFSANVEARQSVVAEFVAAIFAPKKSTKTKTATPTNATSTDAEIVTRASNAKNGSKFSDLWAGNWQSHYGSQSEADLALCSLLYFWTASRESVARMFAQSGLMREKWQREDYQSDTLDKACTGETYSPNKSPSHTGAKVAAAMADDRPKLRLPGDDSLLSDFSAALGEQLRDKGIYYRNGEVVALDDGALRPLDGQRLRTTVEKYAVCYRQRRIGEQTYTAFATMRIDDANGVIVAPQFTGQLLKLRRVNHARLPVLRTDGRVELLPVGCDLETQTLTLPGIEYKTDLALADAVEIVNDLLSEFCFADGERSKAVALAAMLGLYAGQLLPEKSLRPCFIFAANAEGAGKTLLVSCIVTPTLGELPTGCKADADDEIRKVLLTAVREGRAVVFLDNLKGRLNCPPLEAFCSATIWTDRKLGVNESITADNLATVFITGNGLTVSPDMRRRSLFVELHLEVERAEDRQFRRPLDLPALLAMRPKILAALWSMVKHWNTQGRPAPSRSHSAFPSWANIVAGIVESVGFACPLQTANATAATDQDGDDMRQLVVAMADSKDPLSFADVVTLARSVGCFDAIIGSDETELDRKAKSTLAKLLTRYDRRLVGSHRFVIEGKGHARKYRVTATTPQHGQHGQHGVSPQADICQKSIKTQTPCGPCDHAADPEKEEVLL